MPRNSKLFRFIEFKRVRRRAAHGMHVWWWVLGVRFTASLRDDRIVSCVGWVYWSIRGQEEEVDVRIKIDRRELKVLR